MELMDEEMELIQQHQVPCVFMMNANANIREKRDDARRRFNGVDRKKAVMQQEWVRPRLVVRETSLPIGR